MATIIGKVAGGNSKTAGTTLTVTFNQAVPIGTILFICVVFDNHNSTTASVLTMPNIGGVAPTNRLNAAGSGQTTTAGSGVWLRWYSVKTTALINSGATVSLSWATSIVAKACVIVGVSGPTAITPVTGATTSANGSTSGAPSSITSGTAPTPPALVVGCCAFESASATGDSDTLNGTWSSLFTESTAGSTDNTNITAGIQIKDIDTAGVQTWNPTGAADSVTSVLSFVSDVAPSPPAVSDFAGFGMPL